MRRLVGTEIGLIVGLLAGALVTYVGVAVAFSGRDRVIGAGVLVLGGWLMLAVLVVHDRAHLERGEPGHALWGLAGRRKPRWWRGG